MIASNFECKHFLWKPSDDFLVTKGNWCDTAMEHPYKFEHKLDHVYTLRFCIVPKRNEAILLVRNDVSHKIDQ